MTISAESRRTDHWLIRLACGIAALFCLALGVVGLVLPIIPGIVFLALGGVLLSKASARASSAPALLRRPDVGGRSLVSGYSSGGHAHSGLYRKLGRTLPATDRLRLGGWLLARSMVNGLQSLLRTVTGSNGR